MSDVTISDQPVTSSEFTLTWMDISMTSSNFRHYRVFYLPERGPYGPIMASNGRKRQLAQTGELTMNFTGTTGTLTNLNGAVTYRVQVAAVTMFDGQEIIGDRSTAINVTTLEGGKEIYTFHLYFHLYIILTAVPTAPRDFKYMNPTNIGGISSVTLTWSRPDPPNGLITQYNVSDITN